ncbi:MAG: hypothetical protein IOMNBAOH_02396 [Rhodocyclaceae bacterium]|nr:hypothetical protein [Rhodocyclaceae bacterium]
MTCLSGVQRQDAYAAAADLQRQQRRGTEAAGAYRAADRCAQGLGFQVIDDHRHPVQQYLGDDRIPGSRHAVLPGHTHFVEIAVVHAGAGDDIDIARRRAYQADPGQPEQTMLDRDPAGLVEQLLPIAHPHERGIDAAQHRIDPVQALDVRLLGFLLRDVAGDRGNEGDPAIGGTMHDADLGHRDLPSVPIQQARLAAPDAVAQRGRNGFLDDEGALLRGVHVRNGQLRNVLFGAHTEQVATGPVQVQEGSAAVCGGHQIGGGFDDGCELAHTFLCAPLRPVLGRFGERTGHRRRQSGEIGLEQVVGCTALQELDRHVLA